MGYSKAENWESILLLRKYTLHLAEMSCNVDISYFGDLHDEVLLAPGIVLPSKLA